MNRSITSQYSLLTMFRWQPYFILTALALGFFALPQRMQAVSPAQMEAILVQHGGGAERPFGSDHWPGKYSSWLVFA